MIQVALSIFIAVVMVVCFASIYFTRRSTSQKLKRAASEIENAIGKGHPPNLYKIDKRFRRLQTPIRHLFERINQNELEIRSQSGASAVVLENLEEGVIAVGARNQVLLFNGGAERILKINPKAIVGKPLIEALRSTPITNLLSRAIHSKTRLSEVFEIHYPSRCFLQVYAAGISEAGSNIRGILVLSDVTEVKRLENLRRDFVANASHELKTPLTSIKGFTETLQGSAGKNPEKGEMFLKLIAEDVDRLERLINNLLDLSRIESQHGSFGLVKLNWNQEFEQVIALFQPKIKKRNLSIENKIATQLEILLIGDRDQLRQVIVNLIDNAIKFNQDGGKVIINMIIENNSIRTNVQDTGVGIPLEDLGRVFERFYRVDKARSREQGGTGLGLSIVKHIIQSHNGQISCSSVLGKGTNFEFVLPLASKK